MKSIESCSDGTPVVVDPRIEDLLGKIARAPLAIGEKTDPGHWMKTILELLNDDPRALEYVCEEYVPKSLVKAS